jgi:hypothetical protein
MPSGGHRFEEVELKTSLRGTKFLEGESNEVTRDVS